MIESCGGKGENIHEQMWHFTWKIECKKISNGNARYENMMKRYETWYESMKRECSWCAYQ